MHSLSAEILYYGIFATPYFQTETEPKSVYIIIPYHLPKIRPDP
jgi:hypothetical protein